MTRVVAIVPVRGGSQRVSHKNSRPFAGSSLLDLKLEVLAGLQGVDEVVVTTDCDKCMAIAREHGVSLHRRDAYFSGSSVTNDRHWRHIAEITPGDAVFMTQVTSPLVRRSTYEAALRSYLSSIEEFDSLNSVSLERKFLWQDGAPLNYDSALTPKSQNLPEIVSLNFAITIIDREKMMNRGNVVGESPQFLQLDKIESVDVDDEADFKIAEALFREVGQSWLMR